MRGIISPKLEGFLEQANTALAESKRNKVEWTPTLIRGNLDKLAALMSESVAVEFIENRAFEYEGRQLQARVYSPAPDEKLPVILHFHGGGHMCGSVELYDPISRHLAKTAHCVVICVEYRLAPEHPYPAGIHDCQHALIHYKQVLENIGHNDTVAIVGDSAGGAICTTLTMNSLKNSAIKIDKQILIYPSVDYTMSSPSMQSNGTGFLLEQDKIRWYFQQYFIDSLRSDAKSIPSTNSITNANSEQGVSHEQIIKQASPLFGPFSNKMPETLIFTAGCDPLRDEGLAYAHALHEAGVKVEHHQFDGLIHAYMLLHDLVKDECQQTYAHISEFMK
ncbi:alpha/beta hydrolase [Shewanella sp. D64]|uniref:alpha/beta hydrolase n=1 Tax=unclassified Shewanella TaxID=196818 RepID=UPI0022BA3692|nr:MULTISPECIES: alpha/beta hydrolase [unclassified Shewanella]MEC4725161.1 alpha/beta hydrolase [Shewanella sp. D64]MEC4737062.1 alpha/beta hydrolase [Shewanella sp. E94]WBJ96647.1 alpha/beta hydrolase [Shewanella sp. MTB7]